jgi:hypothetical protein
VQLLLSVDVSPYLCQVALADPVTRDDPIPEPDEEVFATPDTVAVSTRSDYIDGDLRDLPVEVWLEDAAPARAPGNRAVLVCSGYCLGLGPGGGL